MSPSYTMNEKITIQDLANIIAEKHGMGKKDAETFIKGMFDLVEEALTTEKYVKVKGLGMFKLTEVDSRESINVNTGERIEIQGHTKISFTPDALLKELINKPFSHFETVVLNEGVQLDDTKEEMEERIDETVETEIQETINEVSEESIEENIRTEEVSISNEIEEDITTEKVDIYTKEDTQLPIESIIEPTIEVHEEEIVQEEVIEEKEEEEEIAPEEVIEEKEEEEEEIVPEEVIEEKEEEEEITPEEVIEEKEEEEEIVSEEVIEEKKEEEEIVPEKVIEEKKEEKTNKGLIIVTILLVIIILGGAYWLFRPTDTNEDIPEVVPTTTIDTLQILGDSIAKEDTTIVFEKTNVPMNDNEKKSVVSEEKVASLADTTEYVIIGTRDTYTLQNGETLIRVSLKYFGTKNFWPYIAKHNEKSIKNANNVPIGTELLIPELAPKK